MAKLNSWAIDRLRLIKAIIPENFRKNYYSLDEQLMRELTATDASVVAQVETGTMVEQDAEVNAIRVRAFDTQKQPDSTVASGECVIDLYKIYNVTGLQAKEHFSRVFPLKVIELEYRLPKVENAARQHGLTMSRVADRKTDVRALQQTTVVMRTQAYRRNLFAGLERVQEIML